MAQTMFPKVEFENIKRLNPYWSEYTCFAEAIKGKKYLRRTTIRKWFDALVSKDDYLSKDKPEILGYLHALTLLER
jgi:hypothetical protein